MKAGKYMKSMVKASLERGESKPTRRSRNGPSIIKAVSSQVWLEQTVCAKGSSRCSREAR